MQPDVKTVHVVIFQKTTISIWILSFISTVNEERLLLKILKNGRHLWVRPTIRHSEFVVNILEGAISGKQAVGRLRLPYLKQVARNTGVDSYTAMKRTACNKSRWKVAKQSKDWVIGRRRRSWTKLYLTYTESHFRPIFSIFSFIKYILYYLSAFDLTDTRVGLCFVRL